MFHIEYDPATGLLRISVQGFWQPEQVPALARTVAAEARAARALNPDFDVLVVSFGFPVQANDVADQLTLVMQQGMLLTTGRAAVVVGSQLNRLQAERTLVHPRLRVFSALDAASAWLAERHAAASKDRATARATG